ncbi:ribosome biogenesis GTPase Der [Oleidesulfovibrio sp.]|uniref:ribosome biogenesis GTPase Der n=1 Tax=Oleidesulfovibrio sp. TaxID=2909707 RepID=UPI003A84D4A4
MLPKIALIGRPNVGKSTLFNRLIRSNRAITHDRPGVTRDRMEGYVKVEDRKFIIIDTGGITLDEHAAVTEGPDELRGFEAEILRQTEDARRDSLALCLVVDGREGLTPFDESLADYVRKSGKPVLLAVNKVDGEENADLYMAEFHALGFPIIPLSGAHGFNIRAFSEELFDLLPPEEEAVEEEEEKPLKIAMLGRPNAGKSSLVNVLTGSQRMIVSDVAGTTRDSVDITVEIKGERYVFVDTAGVRRRAKIQDPVERYSVNSSLKSTTKANVTMVVLDAMEGLTQQDKRLIDLLDERKTPFMLVINKIDLVPRESLTALKRVYNDALTFCKHVPILYISAMQKRGIDKLLPIARRIHKECYVRVGTGLLNRTMTDAITRHQPPVVKRVRPKFFYLTQAETNPPTFVFFVNDHERIKESYARYLEKYLRKTFEIEHAPMRVRFRSSHKKNRDKK